MAEFTPITSQEEFDSRLAERLERERKAVRKSLDEQYSTYIKPDEQAKIKSDYEIKINDLAKQLESLNAKYADEIVQKDNVIKGYETNSAKMRIAHEAGLPYDAINFLNGEDEESIRLSAENLRNLMQVSQPQPPLKSTEADNNESNAYQELLKSLNIG